MFCHLLLIVCATVQDLNLSLLWLSTNDSQLLLVWWTDGLKLCFCTLIIHLSLLLLHSAVASSPHESPFLHNNKITKKAPVATASHNLAVRLQRLDLYSGFSDRKCSVCSLFPAHRDLPGLLLSPFLPLQIYQTEPSQAPSFMWPGRPAAVSERPPGPARTMV